jgi:membrane-bound lytic murein transglycosylase D
MRATIAASMYLRDLYNVFQNWYLAMAAYNAGENRILGAIMRSNTRDFWEMVRKRSLPVETMNYIPKFIAATTIGHDLKRYGFEDVVQDIAPQLVGVNVPAPVKLTDIARISGIPHATLAEFNPHLRRGITPPGQATYRIWVPKDMQDKLNGTEQKLSALRVKNAPVLASVSEESSTVIHRVRKGEHLNGIAKKYGLTLAALKKLNNLKSNRVNIGQRLRVASPAAVRTAEVRTEKSHTTVKYRVKRGDNLDKIARKFNTSVPEIKRLNNLKRNSIMAGQVITVNNKRG